MRQILLLLTLPLLSFSSSITSDLQIKIPCVGDNINDNEFVDADLSSATSEPVISVSSVSYFGVSPQGTRGVAIPNEHNKRLDDFYRKYATNDEEAEIVNSFLRDIYENCGTYLASARIQHEIDRQQLYALLDEDTETLSRINPQLASRVKEIGPSFFNSVKPRAEDFSKWLEEEYSSKILNFLSFDHKPTAEEVLNKLDFIAYNRVSHTEEENYKYYEIFSFYEGRYANILKDNIGVSELIAYKMYMIDSVMFLVCLEKSGVFKKLTSLESYIDRWIKSSKPDVKRIEKQAFSGRVFRRANPSLRVF